MTPDLRSYGRADELARALAAEVASRLRLALAARPSASLGVSGGRTPQALFMQLAAEPLDWSRVQLTLADERWVAMDDPASNEAMVRRHLLQGQAAAAKLIGLKTPAPTPEQGVAECEQRLRALPQPIDVVLLGMGLDGHTASWFPDAPELAAALATAAPCLALNPPSQTQARISLSLAALAPCRWCALQLQGEDKRQVLQRALQGADPLEMPVRLLWQKFKQAPVVYWTP